MDEFFPRALTVRVGDTVVWTSTVYEVHDVVFYSNGPVPPFLVLSPTPSEGLIVNPVLAFPAAPAQPFLGGFAASPLLTAATQASWNMTFGKAASYNYTCSVHYPGMQATLTVIDAASEIVLPSPKDVDAAAAKEIAALTKLGTATVAKLDKQAAKRKPKKNADGTHTHTVIVGAALPSIDFVRFFPPKLAVGPKDTIVFQWGHTNMAPHTVTFLNGEEPPALIIPIAEPKSVPHLQLNPIILVPSRGNLVDRTHFWNSGLVDPGVPLPNVTVVLDDVAEGPLPFLCILHYSSGMVGKLIVGK